MKKLVSWLLFFFFLTLSTNSLPQWAPANSNLNSSQWGLGWAIDAVDSNCAVISVSYGTNIFRTLDGGKSWGVITPLNSSSTGVDISVVDSLNIWFGSGDGKIFATFDGGKNWAIQFDDTSKTNFMNYIKMFDSKNGIAMGDGKSAPKTAVFLKTTDGGINWVSVNDSAFGDFSGDTWRRLDFVSPNVGYFYESGLNPQSIYKTTDGCKTWKKLQTPAYAQVLKFYDENFGLMYTVASNSTVYRTTNGGESWTSSVIPSDKGWGNDIEFLKNDPSKVWLGTKNALYFSSDGGQSWNKNMALSTYGRDIVFTDTKCGWFLSDDNIYRTTNNGGVVVGIEDEASSPLGFSLEQNYPNPFNPSTTIQFKIEKQSVVLLQVYNYLGELVTTLVDQELSAGLHKVNFDAAANLVASGIYYYKLRTGNSTQTKGMIYLK